MTVEINKEIDAEKRIFSQYQVPEVETPFQTLEDQIL